MRAPIRLAMLLLGLGFSGAAFAQTEPPLVTADDAPPVPPPAPVSAARAQPPPAEAVEAEDPEARSAWRIHVSAGAGMIANAGGGGVGPGTPTSDLGGLISFGKPLYEGDRHPRYQWVTDTAILIGYAPGSRRAMLVMSPTIGTNFYLGSVFGLEWRAGGGFGATPSAQTNLGLGVVVEGVISLRLFSDDRRRIKLVASDVGVLGFLTGRLVSFTSAAVSIAFETPLF